MRKSIVSDPLSTPLPVDAVLGALGEALAAGPGAVLQAPPGAGKTTRVPLALLAAEWLAGKRVVMLQPRRLAARAAAYRMADTLGEAVGQTVGYRVRLDSRVGPATRIEVVTEGVLTRLLQHNSSLDGVGLVIFDEFHERSLEADLGLALCLDLQGALNESLRLLVMSATLDSAPVATLMGGVPVVTCSGNLYPVETRRVALRRETPIERAVADTVVKAAAEESGSMLVFLPGAAEIGRVERLLALRLTSADCILAPLYGNLTRQAQDRAIAPAPPGKRKIVLATSIAETSLTIDGIRVVIDSGLMRVPRYDVRSAMTRLETVPVSLASADQRRGRAGRTAPGVCYRLWPAEADLVLSPYNRPEILEADLASLALELAAWGVADPRQLAWLDPPPAAAFGRARDLLSDLGALDEAGLVTAHGRRMAVLPLHPRLAHMLLMAQAEDCGGAACSLAALVSERDILRFAPGEADADIGLRLDILQRLIRGDHPPQGAWQVDWAAVQRVSRVTENLVKRLRLSPVAKAESLAGRLLAWAYPDRIAQRRPGEPGRFLLANGRGAYLPAGEPLAAADYLVAASLDGKRREARIFLAASYDEETLRNQYGGRVCKTETIGWDTQRRAVSAVATWRLGALVLGTEALPTVDPAHLEGALLEGIRMEGIACLPWTKVLRQWQLRVLFLKQAAEEEGWPDVSDAGLAEGLADWLGPWLTGVTRLRDLARIDLKAALGGLLTGRQRHLLDRLAPTHWVVPSGSKIPIDYGGESPVLAVRLQEMFGAVETPALVDGRRPLVLHLLSPAGRPVQVTRDLASFWRNGYPEVRKELRGRYPKHHWPEDPLTAPPTRRTKRKSP